MLEGVPHHRVSDPERLHSLIDGILLIEADLELDVLLRRIVTEATVLVDARYGALGVLDADGTGLREFITVGISDEARARIGSLPVGKGLLGAVINEQRTIRIDDLHTDPSSSGFPANHPDMTRFLGVPVRLDKGETFGNLYLCDRVDGEPFSDEDEAVVESLGRAAGLVITLARLREQVQVLTLADERARLARDLHDTVVQRLFAVGLSLQAVVAGLDADARERVLTAIDDLDSTVREIRTTIFEISRDRTPGETGMRARVLALVDEVTSRLELPVSVEFSGPIEASIGSECADHVVRAARELLTNVVRHAEAQRAWLRVSVRDGTAMLVVEDDGRGIADVASVGRGLGNLRERAGEVGGAFAIEPRAGGGTTATFTATWLR